METTRSPYRPEDHFMKIKGRDYLPVAQRLIWWREEHPDGYVKTELIHADYENGYFVSRAEVGWVTPEGQHIYATGHKSESVKDFPDPLEKSETGAVGRCLALLGYGTQFAQELDEGERIVDSPVERPTHKPPPTARTQHQGAQERNRRGSPTPAARTTLAMVPEPVDLEELRAHVVSAMAADPAAAALLPKEPKDMNEGELAKTAAWLARRVKSASS